MLQNQCELYNKGNKIKPFNEAINRGLTKIKNALFSIKEEYQQSKTAKGTQKCQFIINTCEEVMNIKNELSNITKQFKQKVIAMKEDVSFIVETKSHNLKTFADELLGFLNSLTMSIDHFHNDLVKLKNLAIHKTLNHHGKEKSLVLNLQVGPTSTVTKT